MLVCIGRFSSGVIMNGTVVNTGVSSFSSVTMTVIVTVAVPSTFEALQNSNELGTTDICFNI